MSTSHHDVAHSFAHRGDYDRNGSNMFHDGTTIYSYGHHFPIATHPADWIGVVLFTTQGYSTSTSKHISYTRRALSHRDLVFVHNILARTKGEHEENIKMLISGAEHALDKASRARTCKEEWMDSARSNLATAKRYHEHYFPRRKFNYTIENIPEETAKERKRLARRVKAAEKKQREAMLDAYNEWKAGERGCFHGGYGFPLALRLSHDGERIETSQGARVDVESAKKFFALCKACKDKGKGITKFSHKIGNFVPDSIDEKGNAVVGCHTLPWEEMERMNKVFIGESK